MTRNTEIKKITLALKEYWLQHPQSTFGEIISSISQNTTHNFDPLFLDDKLLYNYLMDNITNSDKNDL